MAQTFDIRFARTAGLAALLEAPENRFRWKGGGLLSINAKSISFTVKRSLLALFTRNRTHRIPAENLRAVYREGDALRVEFQTDETARVVLPFWAVDRDIAAQIVRLLPTSQTVEIEHSTAQTGKRRADWRVLSSGAVLAAIAAGSWAMYQRSHLVVTTATVSPSERIVEGAPPTSAATTMPVEPGSPPVASTRRSAQWVESPAFPLNPARPELATTNPNAGISYASSPQLTADGMVPFERGTPAYEAARRQLDLFQAECNTLRGYFQDARYAANEQRFREIRALWWKVAWRVSNSPDFEDPALKPLQEIELAVSRAWRRAFSFYGDPALLVMADAEVEFAEMLQARASQYVQ